MTVPARQAAPRAIGSGGLSRPFYALLLLVLSLSSGLLFSIAAQGRIGDTFGASGWQGETHKFDLTGSTLTLVPDGQAGTATIYSDYTSESDQYTWRMRCEWEMVPTRYNFFEWHLISSEQAGLRQTLLVRPSSSGGGILLLARSEKLHSGGTYEQIEEQQLALLQPPQPITYWHDLSLQVQYDSGRVRIGIFSLSILWSDWVTWQAPSPSERLSRMALRAIYTKTNKSKMAWSLPEVTPSIEVSSLLQLSRVEVSAGGLVQLFFNAPISIEHAHIEVPGFSPVLSRGVSDRDLLIDLQAPLHAGLRYQLALFGIQDEEGKTKDFFLEIEGSEESLPDRSPLSDALLISEVMAKPPATGPLSDLKYIELYNASDRAVSLADLLIHYRNSTYPLPDAVLPARSYILLLAADQEAFAPQQALVCVLERFPALSGEFELALGDRVTGDIWDRITVRRALYGYGLPPERASVERLSLLPHAVSQWRRSDHPHGGTPGRGTLMQPIPPLARGAVVLNELMLAPPTTGERYVELYNASTSEIDLSAIYIAYRSKPGGETSYWRPFVQPLRLSSGAYAVLTTYPEALLRLYPGTDASLLHERIDLPSFSATYAEIELYGAADDTLIDRVIYRRQYLGDSSQDRSGYALERIDPTASGDQKTSWRRASDAVGGGTPGRLNSVAGASADASETDLDGIEDPELDLEQLLSFAPAFPDRLRLRIYSLRGQLLACESGTKAVRLLSDLQRGEAPFYTGVLLVSVEISRGERLPPLTYRDRWIHTRF